MQQRWPQAESSPGRLIPGPVQESIFGMRHTAVDGASESADAQREPGGKHHIFQQAEFSKVAGIVSRVPLIVHETLPAPKGEVWTPPVQIHPGGQLISATPFDRQPALRRFKLAREV